MKRLAFCLTMLIFLSGCGSFELTDSPYLRITRAQPNESYLVAVQARLVPTDYHVPSSLAPEQAGCARPPAGDCRSRPGFAAFG